MWICICVPQILGAQNLKKTPHQPTNNNKKDQQNPKTSTNQTKNPQTCKISNFKRNRERNTCIYSDTKLRPIIKTEFLPYEQIASMVEQLEVLLFLWKYSHPAIHLHTSLHLHKEIALVFNDPHGFLIVS